MLFVQRAALIKNHGAGKLCFELTSGRYAIGISRKTFNSQNFTTSVRKVASSSSSLIPQNVSCSHVSDFNKYPSGNHLNFRTFSSTSNHLKPLTKEEEEKEKERVAGLSAFQKEMELRDLDDQISRLNTLRGINTGELYTLRGKFKALARDYGIGFMVWYWAIWSSTAVLTYGAITVGDVDVIALLAKLDTYTGLDISSKVDPALGTIALTVAVNELLEPLRLPIVVVTTKPVVNFFSRGNRR